MNRSSAILISLTLFASLLTSSCDRKQEIRKTASGLTKIRVGYIGITCEAPIFTAVEKGFFREEGLEPELVPCQWSQYKDVLALGGFDITHHLIMYFLKPLEQGMDVKFTGGIHRGCLRVQAGAKGTIHSIEDLRNKRIGVPGMGTPPFVFANRVLGAHGIDPTKEIDWRVYPAGDLGLALDKGLVDAVADSEPIGSLLLAQGKVRNISDQAADAPYSEEYCCAVLVNAKFLAANPKAAAAGTRALLKAAKWVDANPVAAAQLSVDKKYINSSSELNAIALKHLRYVPSVSGAEAAVHSAALEMKKAGMLNPRTDVDALVKKAFVHLDGVTDQWIDQVTVEHVPNGQLPPGADFAQFATLNLQEVKPACCHAPETH